MVSLYRFGLRTAKDEGDLERWQESHDENVRCHDFIDKIVSERYDRDHIPADSWEKPVKKFGFDRTMWVLANTIQQRNGDRRFSAYNTKWAESIYIPKGRNTDFALRAHSSIVELIALNVREMYKKLGLFDEKYIVPNSKGADFKGKILVLRDTSLKECARNPENQLFYAETGFGCDPSKIGSKVYGVFLSDGEQCSMHRADFLGVIDEAYIPKWASEKLERYLAGQDISQSNESPTPNLGM